MLNRNWSRRTKYNSVKTCVGGIWFDSKREAAYYQQLLWRERAGEIKDIRRQVPYELQPAFVANDGTRIRAIKYIADFTYTETESGREIIVDCKGFRTKEYMLKKKLLLFLLRDEKNFFCEV